MTPLIAMGICGLVFFLVIAFVEHFRESAMAKRTCWVRCPRCWQDLNGNDYSFVKEDKDGIVYYECCECGAKTRFDFNPPVPILLGDWRDGTKVLPTGEEGDRVLRDQEG